MTLKFCTNVQVHKVNYGPKYRPSTVHSNRNFGPRKTDFRFFRFFAKMAAKTTPGSGFLFRFVFSTLDLVGLAQNLKKILRDFFEKFGVKSSKII